MDPKFKEPPPVPHDLPVCFHPGCTERAPYGFGNTLRTEGRHYCVRHTPSRTGSAVEIPSVPVGMEAPHGR